MISRISISTMTLQLNGTIMATTISKIKIKVTLTSIMGVHIKTSKSPNRTLLMRKNQLRHQSNSNKTMRPRVHKLIARGIKVQTTPMKLRSMHEHSKVWTKSSATTVTWNLTLSHKNWSALEVSIPCTESRATTVLVKLMWLGASKSSLCSEISCFKDTLASLSHQFLLSKPAAILKKTSWRREDTSLANSCASWVRHTILLRHPKSKYSYAPKVKLKTLWRTCRRPTLTRYWRFTIRTFVSHRQIRKKACLTSIIKISMISSRSRKYSWATSKTSSNTLDRLYQWKKQSWNITSNLQSSYRSMRKVKIKLVWLSEITKM